MRLFKRKKIATPNHEITDNDSRTDAETRVAIQDPDNFLTETTEEDVTEKESVADQTEEDNDEVVIVGEERRISDNLYKKKRIKRKWKLKKLFRFDILDRYILKKFLGTYFMATLLFLAIIAMFDITEKLDSFLAAPLKETIFDYFMSFLPYFANQLSPLFVFISVIFFTSKMAGNSEIIAILSSGISFRRLLRPYMVGAAVIAALTFALSNYLIPPTNQRRIDYTNKYVKNKKVEAGVNIQLEVSPGVVAFIGRFEGPTKKGYRFSLDKFEGKELVSRMTAQSISYDTTKMYNWTVREYMIRDFNGMNEKIRRGSQLDTILPIEPRDFLISTNDQETLTTPELTQFIRKQRQRGIANIQAFEIERERRYATTAAAFILTLIGMSLSSKKVKGGMGLNIGIGLALSFSYILFSTVTSSFAISGLTTPFIAMEIPNVVYLIIGLVLYYKAAKF